MTVFYGQRRFIERLWWQRDMRPLIATTLKRRVLNNNTRRARLPWDKRRPAWVSQAWTRQAKVTRIVEIMVDHR